ncbi:Serine acetyltransferase [Synechococcus sp. RS9916]|nr:Serine acetyltransferase [Synechococcus sp. RS9916]
MLFCNKNLNLDSFGPLFTNSQQRYHHCLSKKKIKHYPTSVLLHADEYTSFLYILSNEAWRLGIIEVAEVAYLLNRRINNFECFYTRELPDVFHLEHPVGCVLGQAAYGENLVIYQGVTVGGDLKLRYPRIGAGIALFANATIIGNSSVEDNCALGAGVQIYGEKIPANSSISLRNGIQLTLPMQWSVTHRFFSYD